MKTPFAPLAVPPSVNPTTAGPTASAPVPSTRKPPRSIVSSAIASRALPARSRTAAPESWRSANNAPPEYESLDWTVERKRSRAVPDPDR